jgi:hypothetical protein
MFKFYRFICLHCVVCILLCISACNKITCFTCNVPLVRYSYVLGADVISNDCSILAVADTPLNTFLLERGYTLNVDTLWATPILYNQCYLQKDIKYEVNQQFLNKYCKQQ